MTKDALINSFIECAANLYLYSTILSVVPKRDSEMLSAIRNVDAITNDAWANIDRINDEAVKSALVDLSALSADDFNKSLNKLYRLLEGLMYSEPHLIDENSPEIRERCVMILEPYINVLLNKVAETSNVQEATEYFSLLDRIQSYLAKLWYAEHVELCDMLAKFTRDFDRIDDKEWRNLLYEQIRKGRYDV